MNTPFVEGLEFNLLLFELRWNNIYFLGMLGEGLTPPSLAHIMDPNKLMNRYCL